LRARRAQAISGNIATDAPAEVLNHDDSNGVCRGAGGAQPQSRRRRGDRQHARMVHFVVYDYFVSLKFDNMRGKQNDRESV